MTLNLFNNLMFCSWYEMIATPTCLSSSLRSGSLGPDYTLHHHLNSRGTEDSKPNLNQQEGQSATRGFLRLVQEGELREGGGNENFLKITALDSNPKSLDC